MTEASHRREDHELAEDLDRIAVWLRLPELRLGTPPQVVAEVERASVQYVVFVMNTILHPPSTEATTLTDTIKEGTKVGASFSVDATDGTANLQFTDDHGDDVAGPNDSVNGTAVAPVVESDNQSVLTAAAAVEGATPGSWTAQLTPVAEGTANVSVAALANSDGSPVTEADGTTPFATPEPVQVTVTAGPAASLELSVTG